MTYVGLCLDEQECSGNYSIFLFWKSISGGLWTQSPSTGGNSWRNCSTKVAVEGSHVNRRMHPSPSRNNFDDNSICCECWLHLNIFSFLRLLLGFGGEAWVSTPTSPCYEIRRLSMHRSTFRKPFLVSTMLFAWLGFCWIKLKTVDTTGGSIWNRECHSVTKHFGPRVEFRYVKLAVFSFSFLRNSLTLLDFGI